MVNTALGDSGYFENSTFRRASAIWSNSIRNVSTVFFCRTDRVTAWSSTSATRHPPAATASESVGSRRDSLPDQSPIVLHAPQRTIQPGEDISNVGVRERINDIQRRAQRTMRLFTESVSEIPPGLSINTRTTVRGPWPTQTASTNSRPWERRIGAAISCTRRFSASARFTEGFLPTLLPRHAYAKLLKQKSGPRPLTAVRPYHAIEVKAKDGYPSKVSQRRDRSCVMGPGTAGSNGLPIHARPAALPPSSRSKTLPMPQEIFASDNGLGNRNPLFLRQLQDLGTRHSGRMRGLWCRQNGSVLHDHDIADRSFGDCTISKQDCLEDAGFFCPLTCQDVRQEIDALDIATPPPNIFQQNSLNARLANRQIQGMEFAKVNTVVGESSAETDDRGAPARA